MSSGKWCSTCHSSYRGSFAVHASTAKHRHNLHPKGRLNRSDLNRALGIPRLNVRRMIGGDPGDDRERVRKHRRRLPLDGPRHVVMVRRYFRRKGGGWFTYINAAGIEKRIRAAAR